MSSTRPSPPGSPNPATSIANRIDAAARGRVFSGIDAKQAGLVDELGGLQLALNIAKAKAGIEETRTIEIRRYPDETDRWQRVIDRLFKLVGARRRRRA